MKKILLIIAMVAMISCVFAVSVSAAEYTASNKDELLSAISQASKSAEDDIITLTGNDYTGSAYSIDQDGGKITINLTQNAVFNSCFRLNCATTLVINLNDFELRNENQRQGNWGTLFYQNAEESRLEVYNGKIYIKDVCFWIDKGNLVCQNVDVTANEEFIWSSGDGSECEIILKNNIVNCVGTTVSLSNVLERTYIIENNTFNKELKINCPKNGSSIKNNTVDGNIVIESKSENVEAAENNTIIEGNSCKIFSIVSGTENFTIKNNIVTELKVNGKDNGGTTLTAIDGTYPKVSFGGTNNALCNIKVINNATCTQTGEIIEYIGGDTIGVKTSQEALGHNIDAGIIVGVLYENGYGQTGTYIYDCANCTEGVEKDAPKLFTCLGYSAPENGDDGISIKYTVNGTAIAEYERVTGTTLSYGMFATTKQAVGNGDIFDADGNTVSGAITLDVTNSGFIFLSLKMVGFDTENSKEVEFAIGAYAVTTQDGKKSYSYIQEDTPLENQKYAFIKYSDYVK
ncbi:MAG: hypothetical protein J6C61_04925 [Clostridia bacterium]|nr:hypothetical protein [Clostridia bacterium]